MTMGERIRHRREQLGLSQHDLAGLTRMPQTLISRLERGVNKNPGADVLRRLALALRCSSDYIIGLYEDDPADASMLALAAASP